MSLSHSGNREETSAADEVSVEAVFTLPAGQDYISSGEDATNADGSPLITMQQPYMLLPVEHISQLPELPTGCEITALTTVLNYLGFNTDKLNMAENYLKYADSFEGNFYDYFIGDPTQGNGWGCFAPAITLAAQEFLEDNNSTLKAHNISGASLQTLFEEVADGNPVIVWSTSKWGTETTYTPIKINGNTVFNWPSNEHCVVLTGFNLEKNTVYISDPLDDIVERDLTEFAKAYSAYYKQAVVIK